MKSSIKIGDKFTTNEGCTVQVVEYNNKNDIVIQFENMHKKRVTASSLRKGTIRNRYWPSVCGVGYTGEGVHKASIYGKHTRAYSIWKGVIRRCYDPNTRPAYIGCSVCEEWHNFQNFAEWYYEQPNAEKDGFDIDKDLIKFGNRVYSPEFCSILPNEINKLLTDCGAMRGEYQQGVNYHKNIGKYRANLNKGCGKLQYLGVYETPEEAYEVYKREKEKFVKEQAEKYKDVLHPKVYENLMNWSLNID